MSLDVPLSDRRVSGFNDAERLLLWALRHRVAAGDPASPHLVSAFGFMCGATAGPRAQAALNRLVDALETFARRPLAFLDWCNRAVTADEAVVLGACAELQAGRAATRALDALVVPAGERGDGPRRRARARPPLRGGGPSPAATRANDTDGGTRCRRPPVRCALARP